MTRMVLENRIWSKSCYLNAILETLKKDGGLAIHHIDATIIRAHQHAAGARNGQDEQSLGQSRGGFSTKIHAMAIASMLEIIEESV